MFFEQVAQKPTPQRNSTNRYCGWRILITKKRKSIHKFFSFYLSKIKLPQIKKIVILKDG
ncbi:ankyrin repeat domain-containing protein 50-like isoform X4 [Vespula maculifrons]|uniref:Ankyrin repeat domain-containing protein 50-like isoform X4 n=1 Tax=Vespula maculifrons TaxID=7453 RepID=A0ABD2C446_VESMC